MRDEHREEFDAGRGGWSRKNESTEGGSDKGSGEVDESSWKRKRTD